ncbi:enoyl-CoA hydratase/isomerase family protein [bacterium]|nr:enoyl-CoA hydratase/isomerase family protein [bacterium]
MDRVKNVCVIGSGVMGGAIAAHFANCGVQVSLLDIVPKYTEQDKDGGIDSNSKEFRNRIATKGLEAQLSLKPDPFYVKKSASLISVGNLEDDVDKITKADWIIEVVVEALHIKHSVFELVRKHRKKGSFVTSNTSGLSIKSMLEPFVDDLEFQSCFMVTHFFNPVRYMYLLELVAGENTSQDTMDTISQFGSKVLGKGIVWGKDTPNFIANRVGVYAINRTINYAIQQGLTLSDVDKIMGPATGRPKSAVFRTADLVGLDTLIHATETVYHGAPDDPERDVFVAPEVVKTLVKNGSLGQKSGKGFYEKRGKEIFELDLRTLEYLPPQKKEFKSLKKGKAISDVGKRVKAILSYTEKLSSENLKTDEQITKGDDASIFAWSVFRDILRYSALMIGEIADDIVNIDNAMKWGFNWEIGPFETWDAIGVRDVVERMKNDELEIPETVLELLKHGESFYKKEGVVQQYFDFNTKSYKPIPEIPNALVLSNIKETKEAIYKNSSATIHDIGDDVLALEFHTKMNAIDTDIINSQFKLLELAESRGAKGVVVYNDGEHFSAGANLMQILMAVNTKKWDDIEKMVHDFQYANKAFKFASFPVVVATHSLTLGGGCEIAMHGTHVRTLGETYMGLVEVGVGVIPGGGGTKELLFKNRDLWHRKQQSKVGEEYPKMWDPWRGSIPGPMFPVIKSFEVIGMAKIATSGPEAVLTGYLKKETTRLTTNKAYLLADAKNDVLEYSKNFVKNSESLIYLPGADTVQTAIKMNIEELDAKGLVTPHDKIVAMELAYVMGGGKTTYSKGLSEDNLLDLEREAFMKLLGTKGTQERIAHMLQTGKPLRN